MLFSKGVLESLTSIVPESVMTPDKTPPPSCDSPRPDTHDSPSIRLPHYQLPTVSVPHLMSSSSVQINNHTFGGKKSERDRETQIQYPGNVLQFKTHQHLQAQIGMGGNNNKARLPYPSPYSTSSTASSASSSGGEVINLSNNKNRTSGGSAYSPYSRSSGGAKSPKSTSSMSSSGGGSTNGNGIFIGTTSILDNLLKNPRTHLEAAIAAAAAAAAHNAAAANEANDNNDMVQYEAEGYLENCRSSPHNLTAAHLRQLQEQHSKGQGHPPYYCSPGSAGHPALVGANGGDDDNNMEMTMTEDSTPIPAHLLEPNVEYHIGNEYPDRYGTLHNPLADLAKVWTYFYLLRTVTHKI